MVIKKIKQILVRRLNITEYQIDRLIEMLGLTEEQIKDQLDKNNITENDVNILIDEITNHFKNPLNMINLISKYIDDFEDEVQKANKIYGSNRKIYIERRIESINNIPRMNPFENELVHNFIVAKRSILDDQLDFWRNELFELPQVEDKFLRIDINYRLKEIKSTIESLKDVINFLEKMPNFYYGLNDNRPLFKFENKLNEIDFTCKNLNLVLEYLKEDTHKNYVLELNNDLNYILSCVRSKEDTVEIKKIQNIIRPIILSNSKSVNNSFIKFQDFFNDDLPIKTIEKIRDLSKNYQGKDLAIFIHLAVHEFNIMHFKHSDRKGKSAKDFTLYFKKNNNYSSVNKYLYDDFSFNGNHKDLIHLKTQISEILKPVD